MQCSWMNGFNIAISALAQLNTGIKKIVSQCSIHSLYLSVGSIKKCMWRHFVDMAIDNGKLCID